MSNYFDPSLKSHTIKRFCIDSRERKDYEQSMREHSILRACGHSQEVAKSGQDGAAQEPFQDWLYGLSVPFQITIAFGFITGRRQDPVRLTSLRTGRN
ncbi:MAG: hypothetical protein GY774_40130 [Planctomycetes bacterium]|nr:hypothetical protein [Planctomycetota bacterium]